MMGHGKAGSDWLMRLQIVALRNELAALKGERPAADLREAAGAKLRTGANLRRSEVAAYLGVSTRKIQRMEAARTLTRCPGFGTVVRYAARDVLRLASAQ